MVASLVAEVRGAGQPGTAPDECRDLSAAFFADLYEARRSCGAGVDELAHWWIGRRRMRTMLTMTCAVSLWLLRKPLQITNKAWRRVTQTLARKNHACVDAHDRR